MGGFFHKEHYQHFRQTGIFPHEPGVVLDKITRPEPPLVPISQERTPMTCQAVQRMHKAYKKSPKRKRLSFIFRANTRLAAQHSIDKHTITGLITALKHEKTKRCRGKGLNLAGEEDNGPQFYSPSQCYNDVCALGLLGALFMGLIYENSGLAS
jgi:hypothetical protein